MKKKMSNFRILLLLLAISFVGLSESASAQNAAASRKPPKPVKNNSAILYHGGPLLVGTSDVYFIWYGCWDATCGASGDTATQTILTDFIQNVGGSPYFQINATYANSNGFTPSGGLLFGGSVVDNYSHGMELTPTDLQGIVADKITSLELPQDPLGIYVVLASADVSSPTTGFCDPSARPYHGLGEAIGVNFPYAFVGNPLRCPTIEASQFFSKKGTPLPTPNGNLAADAMATTIAHLLDEVVTNPYGSGWFDKYGLENADKCDGEFGTTYLTATGARANLRLGLRDYLIPENWVNDGKGRCAMNQSQQ